MSFLKQFRVLACAVAVIAAFATFTANASAAVLLYSAHNNQKVYSYDGTSVAVWGTSPNGAFHPTGIAQAPNGNVYVNDFVGNHFVRYPVSGGVGTELINEALGSAEGAAFGPDGKLYIANFTTQSIVRYTLGGPNGVAVDGTWFPSPGDGDEDPGQVGGRSGLVFNGNDLYFSNLGQHQVLRYNNIVAVPNSTYNYAADLVLDSSNNGIFQPYGLTFDNGNLLVACLGLNKIISFDLLSPGTGTDFLPGSGPVQVLRSPDDGRLYVSNATGGTITRYESNGTGPVNIASGLNVPHFMTFISVPEPGSMCLLLLGGACLLRRRNSRYT